MPLFLSANSLNFALIARLRLLEEQILDHPARPETVTTWEQLSARLPLDFQENILLAWNKHLAEINESGEISATIERIVEQISAGN